MHIRNFLISSSTIIGCNAALILLSQPAFGRTSLTSPAAQSTETQSASDNEDLRGVPQARFNFQVAPGPLRRVLDEIAAQSGATYRSQELPDVQSPGVTGYMTLHEAVVRATLDAGIRTVSVRKDEIRLTVAGATDRTDDIVVTGRRAAFKENFSSSATRTNTPLRQTPATVDAVTADVLESRNAFTLGEALQNIPGAIFQAGTPNQVRFGPQSTAGVTFTDGLRNGSLNDNTPTVLLDAIEVVKGPASILTGTQAGGGLVNYVPKRANGVSAPEITLGGGTGTEVLASADFGGAVPGIDKLYYRVIGFAQRADRNPAGGSNPYQYVITPMVGLRAGNTTIDLNYQYSTQRLPFARRDYFNTKVVNGVTVRDGPIKSLRGLYNPDSAVVSSYQQIGYNFEQGLADSGDFTLKLRARGLYQWGEKSIAASAVAATVPAAGLFVVASISQYAPEWTTSHSADLYAKFDTGPLEHQVIVGGDYSYRQFGRSLGLIAAALRIDQFTTLAPVPPASAPRSSENYRQYGAFIQDQINAGRLHALLGMRRSWYDSNVRQVGATTTTFVESQKWTPTLGLVVDVAKWASVYGSYTEAFSPQTASTVSFDGTLLPPTLQKRKEVGFKTGLFNDRLDLNGSAFWVSTDNEARVDPAHPGFSIPGPGRVAHGFQIAAAGSISPTLKLTAGYTYTDGKLVNGDPLDQSPKNVANLWAVKTFKIADNQDLDIGLGGNYYDQFYIGATGARVLFDRDHLSLDASIAYKIDKLRFNLTVSNLLDRNNYQLSGAPFQLEEAPPRVVRLIMSAKF